MDSYELQCEMTEPGRDVAEGNIAYRIEERGGKFLVIEYLADEPHNAGVVEECFTRTRAERAMRQYVRIQSE